MSSTVVIRGGTEFDLEQVTAIKVANWAATYRELIQPDVLAQFLDHQHAVEDLMSSIASADAHFLVAEESAGRIAGFSLAFLDEVPDPWLESLHVAATARGRGIGTSLMQEVARAIRARGRNSMRLGVVKGNEGAGRLYRRLGAAMIAVERASWATGVDHEIYRWADLARLAGRIYNSAS